MIILDASVVIAFLDGDDRHHEEAKNILLHGKPPFPLHPLTLAEIMVGHARDGHEIEVWQELQQLGMELYTPPHDEWLHLARLRNRHRLKMPDICVLAVGISLNSPIATFDVRLRKTASTLGLACHM